MSDQYMFSRDFAMDMFADSGNPTEDPWTTQSGWYWNFIGKHEGSGGTGTFYHQLKQSDTWQARIIDDIRELSDDLFYHTYFYSDFSTNEGYQAIRMGVDFEYPGVQRYYTEEYDLSLAEDALEVSDVQFFQVPLGATDKKMYASCRWKIGADAASGFHTYTIRCEKLNDVGWVLIEFPRSVSTFASIGLQSYQWEPDFDKDVQTYNGTLGFHVRFKMLDAGASVTDWEYGVIRQGRPPRFSIAQAANAIKSITVNPTPPPDQVTEEVNLRKVTGYSTQEYWMGKAEFLRKYKGV